SELAWFSVRSLPVGWPTKFIAASLLVAGCGLFVTESMAHRAWPAKRLPAARDYQAFYQKLFEDHGRMGARISWLILSPAASFAGFQNFLYETGRYDAAQRWDHTTIGFDALTTDDIVRRIEQADAVVVQGERAPFFGYVYPSLRSLQAH